MEIAGLPLHPLVVHATVVLIPLGAMLSVVFAVRPAWRWLTRWPAVAVALLGVVLIWVSTTTGEALMDSRPGLETLVKTHEQRGDLLAWVSIPYAAIVAFAGWALSGPSALASGRGARPVTSSALEKVLPTLVVLAALAMLVLVVLVGDSGARAVWGQ